jgi:hypothetical protein
MEILGVVGTLFSKVLTFDLSSAGSGELFLRLNCFETISPAPATFISVNHQGLS